jgi:hypothetical protein
MKREIRVKRYTCLHVNVELVGVRSSLVITTHKGRLHSSTHVPLGPPAADDNPLALQRRTSIHSPNQIPAESRSR